MNKLKRVTIKDIAQETGFTANTVSRALMNMPDISDLTKAMIKKKADEMGYVRNHMASSLRSGSTHTIALIVGHLLNPYFAIMFDSVESIANQLGYSVMLLCSHEKEDNELSAIRTALSNHVDGIILYPCQEGTRCLDLLRSSGFPFVILSREFESQSADYVLCQEETGGYLAAKHLIEHGHKKLIYVYDSDNIYSINLRREGFLRACREAGLDEKDFILIRNLNLEGKDNAAGTAERIAGLYRLGFDAVVAFCDMIARRLVSQLRQLRLSVPQDIAIIGFDNTDATDFSPFPLCSIDGSCESMGKAAVELLDKRIKGSTMPDQKIIFPVSLVCRNSCCQQG
jgi:LacI family transcriptional regulator